MYNLATPTCYTCLYHAQNYAPLSHTTKLCKHIRAAIDTATLGVRCIMENNIFSIQINAKIQFELIAFRRDFAN